MKYNDVGCCNGGPGATLLIRLDFNAFAQNNRMSLVQLEWGLHDLQRVGAVRRA